MKASIPFKDQISDWFLSMGFECREAQKIAGIFTVFHIFKNNQNRLALVLIDLDVWANENAVDKWPACIQHVQHVRDSGLTTVVLWEDFWLNKKEIVRSRLSAILGLAHKIPARLTKVRRIDKETTDRFLAENHLNGPVSAKYKYGLYLPASYYRVLNEMLTPEIGSTEMLVAVATFSYPRIFNKETNPLRSHELIRFASLRDCNVVGGLDKLLQAFIREKEPGDIMTYADVEWSAGASYNKLGFKKIAQTQPEAFYIDTKTMQRKTETGTASEVRENDMEIRNMGSIKFVKQILN
ncbi:hypothetical protein [Dyadobacter linearis]|nr:hypothetical protein [Dyadobacter sp. CECT 9623]